MKKTLIVSSATLLSIVNAYTQDVIPVAEDAMRISWNKPSGTARNQALGGTNVALGGDLTSLFINPAGIGFYTGNEIAFTPAISFFENNSMYFNNATSVKTSSIRYGTVGIAGNLAKPSDLDIRCSKVVLGVNRLADFNSTLYYKGNNNKSSFTDAPAALFDDYVVDRQGPRITPSDILYSGMNDPDLNFITKLGLNSHLISLYQDPSTEQCYGFSRAADVLDLDKSYLIQENNIKTTGGITEISTGLAIADDNTSYGLSIGVPIFSYKRTREYSETDGSELTSNFFNSFKYSEFYTAEGVGVNVKAGLITNLTPLLRMGIAIHSPTFYKLTNTLSSSITADLENYDPNKSVFTASTQGNNSLHPVEYSLNTPTRIMAGLTYFFNKTADVKKQRGFISADIEYINLRWTNLTKITSDDEALYTTFNNDVKRLYNNGSFNYRAGAELKFSPFMLRGGFSYFNNPYNSSNGLKASMMSYSGGLGYRNKGVFIDAAYVYSINKNVDFPYYTFNKNYYAETTNNISNIIVTLGFKF